MAYYSPYTNSPVISAIGGLRETIHGLSEDYLQKKKIERQAEIGKMEQERQLADIQSAQAVALARTEAEEQYKTRQHGLALQRFGETQKTGEVQRKAAEATIAERKHGQQLVNLKAEFGYSELPPEDKLAFDIILAPLAEGMTRDEYTKLIPTISRTMSNLPSVTRHKEKEELLGKFNQEAVNLSPTSTKPGFLPNSEPVQNLAKHVKTETNGEYEVIPVKWVKQYGPLPETQYTGKEQEELGMKGEPVTIFQEFTPAELHLFRENKYASEPGVKYGYRIRPTRTIATEDKEQMSSIVGRGLNLRQPSYPPTYQEMLGKESAIKPAKKMSSDFRGAGYYPAISLDKSETKEEIANRISSELNDAGVHASEQGFVDMVNGKINVQDYINTHRGQ